MISTVTYNGDGSTRVFPVGFEIKGEDYVVIYINNIAVSDRTTYDIINNSIVFNIGNEPILGTGNVQIVVASSPNEIGDLNAPPSNIQTVLDNLVNINAAVSNETNINTVATNITNVNAVGSNIADVILVVDNIVDIQNAEENSLQSKLSSWVAESNRRTADSYATEPEDTFVKLYTSNGDGSFTVTTTTEYSSLHYATKAQESALIVSPENYVQTTGDETIEGIKTFSSSPIVPTPTSGSQAVNKDYVDSSTISTKEYVDSTVNTNIGQLSTDFYQGPYGFSWDYATDTYIRTGAKGYTAIQSKMRRCVLNADGSVNYYLHPDNSNFKEDGTPSILTGADGNVMVEIPKHYIKVDTVGNVDSMSISLTQEPGYVLDPSFMKWHGTEMVEVPYRYFRAYAGFVSGGKLLSVSGVTPTRSQTIAAFRTQAMANGTGWHLTDWNLLNTIKRLCYIEFCDFIVTKYLGEGNHTGSDFGITTGQSNALGNRSSNSTHNDKYMSYRGIENMYADIWEFVDGININNYQAYINQKWSTFASDVFTGDYVAKGTLIAAGANNSLIKRCNVSVDGGFIPTTVGGSTTSFYGDALWSATGARIALYGGAASDGASAGLGALAVNAASSDSGVYVGAAVCR